MSDKVSKHLSDPKTVEKIEKNVEKRMQDFDMSAELSKSIDRVPGQEFAVVSFAGDKCKPKSDVLGMKIWGTFATLECASVHCSFIGGLEENENYNIFVLEMYKWAAIPPDVSKISDVEYHDEQLKDIITTHHEESIRAREMFDTRKEFLMCEKDRKVDDTNPEISEPSES